MKWFKKDPIETMLKSAVQRKPQANTANLEQLEKAGTVFAETIVGAKLDLETIIDLLPAFILYKDDKNTLVRVNQYTADFCGTTPKEMVGTPTEKWFPEDHAEKYLADDLEVMRTGKPKEGIIEPAKDKGGKVRWYKTSKFPVTNGGGKRYILAFAVEITDEVELKQSLLDECARCLMHQSELIKFLEEKGIDPKEMPRRGDAGGER